ncbi:hypothetical protein HanPI659440_Chr04g0146401 [Helianthus annuus]|nr:hypothetical protein HanPI659440_Chr04g0146401 [Helianthus annuus]
MDTRYGGYGDGVGVRDCVSSHHTSMVDMMMLKFRPIAPKPVASGSGSSDSTKENVRISGQCKRRYIRVKRNECSKKRKPCPSKSTSSEKVSGDGDAVVTLSLMPETPKAMDHSLIKNISSPIWWYSKNNNNQTSRDGHVTPPKRPQTVSFVMVDMVTETTVDGGLEEWTDMDSDTCPRFISDGRDKVVWTNKAYKEMVVGGDEVVVVRKEGGWPAAFTCNVRVTCRTNMGTLTTVTVPCDTWRMESGGHAWRLDVKAALCLGR